MNWNQLGYLCRLFSPLSNLTPAQKKQLSSADHLRVYKAGQHSSQLATKLSAQLIDNRCEHEQQRLALCYEQLPNAISTNGFKYGSRLSYLVFIFTAFIIISLIYQVFVIPSFSAVLSDYHAQLNNSLSDVAKFWYIFVSLQGMLLSLILLSVIRLSQIGNLLKAEPSSSCIDFIIPKKIRQQHSELIVILEFPVNGASESISFPEVEHLQSCQLHGLDISKEFVLLIKQKLAVFNQDAKRYLNKLITIFTITLVIAIALFLKEAYRPIFALGEII